MQKLKKIAKHLQLGQEGEAFIAKQLQKLGWKLLAKNWRPEKINGCLEPEFRGVELDLVALDADCLVFVEVRTRTINNLKRGGSAQTNGQLNEQFNERAVLAPENIFSPSKQKRFIKAGNAWLSQKNMWQYPCRFDLFCVAPLDIASHNTVELELDPNNNKKFYFKHYINALENCHAQNGNFMGGCNTSWQPW